MLYLVTTLRILAPVSPTCKNLLMAAKYVVAVCSSPDSWNGWRGRVPCGQGGQCARGVEELHRYSEPGGNRSPGIGPGSRGCSNAAVAVGGAGPAVARNDDAVAGVGGGNPCSGRERGRRWCCPGVCRRGAPRVTRSGSCSERRGPGPGGSGRRQSRGRSRSGGARGSDGWSLAAPVEAGARRWG